MEALNATGRATLNGSANFTVSEIEACSDYLTTFDDGGQLVTKAELTEGSERNATG